MSRWVCEGDGAARHVPLSLPADRCCPLCAREQRGRAYAQQKMALRLADDADLARLRWHDAGAAWLVYLDTIGEEKTKAEVAGLKLAFFTGWFRALDG